MELTATISQIATALCKTDRAIRKRRVSQGWTPVNPKGVDRFAIEEIGLSADEVKAVKAYLEREHTAKALTSVIVEQSAPAPPVLKPETAVAVATPKTLPALTELKKWQRETMDARIFFMRLIERAVTEGLGVNEAINTIVAKAQAGTLPEPAARLIPLANKRSGTDNRHRTLSYSGMMKWWAPWRKTGGNPAALAPKNVEKISTRALGDWVRDYPAGHPERAALISGIPAWLPYFLDEYRQPQKPSMAEAHRTLLRTLPLGIPRPSYEQIMRISEKVPAIYLQKGRLTGAEHKSLMGYAERDSSEYNPLTICQIDGHSFKAYVAHPTTGAHFHPEVCGIICLTTKMLVGWSWGLAESSRTVADAYRHACTVTEDKPWGGVPAILEADRGAGNMAGVNSDEFMGLFFRVGTTFVPPERGGNPQGHGGIERANQSIWIRAAKKLPTYTGKDMDRVVRKRIYTKLEKDLKQAKREGHIGVVAKTSELLLSKDEFTEFLRTWAIEYNNSPHSALPKITAPHPLDPQGKPMRRHMTPFEAWAKRVNEGWQPTIYEGDLLGYLFMPHERITVRREKFTLHGNSYHAYELSRWHGQDMIAAYDIHDASKVWVMDLEERPICEAKWNGNRVHAHPLPAVQKAVMERENRQRTNLERKLEMVQAAARPAVEVAPTHIELEPEVIAFEERERAQEEQKIVSLEQARKLRDISTPTDVYYLILDRIKAGTVTPYQTEWRKDYEYWDETGKKRGLLLSDPYCFDDPDEQKERENK